MTSNRRGRIGFVTHRKSTASVAAHCRTGSALMSSIDIVSYQASARRPLRFAEKVT